MLCAPAPGSYCLGLVCEQQARWVALRSRGASALGQWRSSAACSYEEAPLMWQPCAWPSLTLSGLGDTVEQRARAQHQRGQVVVRW